MGSNSAPAPKTDRIVFCVKLHKELPGLAEVPFDGHPLALTDIRFVADCGLTPDVAGGAKSARSSAQDGLSPCDTHHLAARL